MISSRLVTWTFWGLIFDNKQNRSLTIALFKWKYLAFCQRKQFSRTSTCIKYTETWWHMCVGDSSHITGSGNGLSNVRLPKHHLKQCWSDCWYGIWQQTSETFLFHKTHLKTMLAKSFIPALMCYHDKSTDRRETYIATIRMQEEMNYYLTSSKYHLQEYDTTPIPHCNPSLFFSIYIFLNVFSGYIYVGETYCYVWNEPDLIAWSLSMLGSIMITIMITFIHPYPTFRLRLLSVSHSMGLSALGFVENRLSMHLCLAG